MNWIENYGNFGFEFANMVTFQLFEMWDGYNGRSPALARFLEKEEQIVGRLNGWDYMEELSKHIGGRNTLKSRPYSLQVGT